MIYGVQGMTYPARGGLVWGQMRGCYLKSGVYTPYGVCITYWSKLAKCSETAWNCSKCHTLISAREISWPLVCCLLPTFDYRWRDVCSVTIFVECLLKQVDEQARLGHSAGSELFQTSSAGSLHQVWQRYSVAVFEPANVNCHLVMILPR